MQIDAAEAKRHTKKNELQISWCIYTLMQYSDYQHFRVRSFIENYVLIYSRGSVVFS